MVEDGGRNVFLENFTDTAHHLIYEKNFPFKRLVMVRLHVMALTDKKLAFVEAINEGLNQTEAALRLVTQKEQHRFKVLV